VKAAIIILLRLWFSKAEVPEEFVQAVKALNRMWGKLSKSRRREIEENPSTEKVLETLSIAALTS